MINFKIDSDIYIKNSSSFLNAFQYSDVVLKPFIAIFTPLLINIPILRQITLIAFVAVIKWSILRTSTNFLWRAVNVSQRTDFFVSETLMLWLDKISSIGTLMTLMVNQNGLIFRALSAFFWHYVIMLWIWAILTDLLI